MSAADYRRVFAQSRRSADGLFTVLATPNSRDQPRLGLAIAKKQVRHAVQRSRIKRLAREAFRLHQRQLAGLDLVVMARHAAAHTGNAALNASLRQHFAKLIEPDV